MKLKIKYYEYSQYDNVLLISRDKEALQKYVKAWNLLGNITEKQTNIFKFWFISQCVPVLYLGKNNKFLIR